MLDRPLGSWLRRLRGAATFVQIAALCLAGASLAIVFIPNAPRFLHTLAPARALTSVAKLTAFGGLAVWLLAVVAHTLLAVTVFPIVAGVLTQPIGNLAGSLLGWLAVALIFAAFGQLIARGVAMRAELDAVI